MGTRKVIIIGAGITGTLTGLQLLRDGWQVQLVESTHVGGGSSSRTAAGIRQQFSTPGTVLGMRFAVDFYKRFCDEVGGDTSPIEQNGYLFLVKGEKDPLEKRVAMQKECGLSEVALLSASDTAKQFPWVAEDAFDWATWCPSDGFLRPEIIYNEAADAIRREGGEILQGKKITAVQRDEDGISAVGTSEEWFSGDLFIDATNAWSPRLARALGATEIPLAPYKRYLWFLERGAGLDAEVLSQMPLIITPSGAYCRPENRDSLLCGWAHPAKAEDDFTYEDQDDIDPEFFHKSGLDSKAYDTWMALAEALPPIGEFAGITATTAGYYGTTPDHNPFLDYDPKANNLMRLVGFSGHGAMFGAFTAEVARQLAEAGGPVSEIEVLGRKVAVDAFKLGRSFDAHEQMVI